MALLKDKILEHIKNGEDYLIDSFFNINYDQVESTTKHASSEAYINVNLNSEGLYTSYSDFYEIGKVLELNGKVFCDLGSGVGRGSLLHQVLFPDSKSFAYEFVSARVKAGKASALALGLNSEYFIEQDLLNTPLPEADIYYIYLPVGPLLFHVLNQLMEKPGKTIVAIESHGDLIPYLDSEKWLEESRAPLKSSSSRHDPHIYFYETREATGIKKKVDELISDSISLCDLTENEFSYLCRKLSFSSEFELVVEDRDVNSSEVHSWMASTREMLFYPGAYDIETKYPERRILRDKVQSIVRVGQHWKFWRELRFNRHKYRDKGEIRKLIRTPEKMIEFNSGIRIKLSDL